MPWRMLIKAITFAAVVLFATSAGATEPPEPTIVAVGTTRHLPRCE